MFDFDDRPPDYPISPSAIAKPEATRVDLDYQWLEKYVPYDSGSENYVHWFLRFK